jgi:hypothetical protein
MASDNNDVSAVLYWSSFDTNFLEYTVFRFKDQRYYVSYLLEEDKAELVGFSVESKKLPAGGVIPTTIKVGDPWPMDVADSIIVNVGANFGTPFIESANAHPLLSTLVKGATRPEQVLLVHEYTK